MDQPGSQSEFVSVGDSLSELFHSHPWSIGGGGASELKEHLDESRSQILIDVAETAIGLVTLEDEAFAATSEDWLRRGIKPCELAGFVEGDRVRDWQVNDPATALFPHDWTSREAKLSEVGQQALWRSKTNLSNRLWFRKTQVERGLAWYEYGMLSGLVTSLPLSIVFGAVATLNHFVLDRGGKVFKQTAPVIKLPSESSEDDHIALLGLLNSSTACFWLKQICQPKGSSGVGRGVYDETWERHLDFNGTNLQRFPLPIERPLLIAGRLDEFARDRQRFLPTSILRSCLPTREALDKSRGSADDLNGRMVASQEELDWQCYRLYA